MKKYIVRHKNGKYVAPEGGRYSYTTKRDLARRFNTREEAITSRYGR